MPVHVAKKGPKFRVVEADGSIAKNAAGTAVDGGGHKSRGDAQAQANAINMRSEMRATPKEVR